MAYRRAAMELSRGAVCNLGSGISTGIATVATPEWKMPMRLHLSGRLHDGDDGVGLDGVRLGEALALTLAATPDLPRRPRRA